MFKNRSLQVKMVKDETEPQSPTSLLPALDYEKLDQLIRQYARAAAVGGVLIYAAVKAIDTTSTVIVNRTNPVR